MLASSQNNLYISYFFEIKPPRGEKKKIASGTFNTEATKLLSLKFTHRPETIDQILKFDFFRGLRESQGVFGVHLASTEKQIFKFPNVLAQTFSSFFIMSTDCQLSSQRCHKHSDNINKKASVSSVGITGGLEFE